MADSKISTLAEAGALVGTEILPLVQGGVTKRDTLNNIKAFVGVAGGTINGTIAANQIPFGTALDTIGGDANLIWDNTNKHLALGVATNANTRFGISKTFSSVTGAISYGVRNITNYTADADNFVKYGFRQETTLGGLVSNTAGLVGISSYMSYGDSSGNTPFTNYLAGGIVNADPGNCPNWYLFKADNIATGGAITNLYGLYISSLTTATNNWAVYTAGTTNSYFGGQIQIAGGVPGAGKVLTSDINGLGSWSTPTSYVGGSGTTNYIPKFTAGTTLGDSVIHNSGNNVGIANNANANATLYINNGTSIYGIWTNVSRSTGTATGIIGEALGTNTGTNTGIQADAGNGAINRAFYSSTSNPPVGSNNWALYMESQAQNYLAGFLGINKATPTASLEIVGADTSASSYALKIHNSTGTNNSFMVRNDGMVIVGAATYSGVLAPDLLVSKAGNAVFVLKNTFDNVEGYILTDATSFRFGTYAATDLRFLTSNTDRIRVRASNGFVGINTTTPDYQLSIIGGDLPEIAFVNTIGGKTYGFNSHSNGSLFLTDLTAAAHRITIDTSGNIGFYGATTFGTSSAGVLAIANGTATTASVANQIHIFSKDSSVGLTNATLGMYLEQTVEVGAAVASTNKIRVWINGVEYYILLTAV